MACTFNFSFSKKSLTQTFGPLDFFLFLFIFCFVDIKKRALLISSVLILKKKTFFNQRWAWHLIFSINGNALVTKCGQWIWDDYILSPNAWMSSPTVGHQLKKDINNFDWKKHCEGCDPNKQVDILYDSVFEQNKWESQRVFSQIQNQVRLAIENSILKYCQKLSYKLPTKHLKVIVTVLNSTKIVSIPPLLTHKKLCFRFSMKEWNC